MELSRLNRLFNYGELNMKQVAEGKLTPDDIISGSQVAAILGRNPYQTPNDTLKRAIDILSNVPQEPLTHESMHWGNTFEVDILNEGCKRLGLGNPKTTFNKAFFHKDLPLAVSLDGMVKGDGRTIQTDPTKNIFLMNRDELTLDGDIIIESKLTGQEIEADLPDYRGKLQLQAQMMCTGAKVGVVCVLYRGVQLRLFVYAEDLEIQKQIADAAIDFDRRVKKFKESQEIDWYDINTTKDATKIFDEDSGEVVDLNDMEDSAKSILQIKDDIKDLEEQLEFHQSKIMAKMRDAKYANAGKYQITWGTINYKAMPEKIIPAKPARTIRVNSLRIKSYE